MRGQGKDWNTEGAKRGKREKIRNKEKREERTGSRAGNKERFRQN